METETQLRLIIDTTPALIYTARPDGHIDFFNQRCLEFLGLPLEEISGWGWTKTIHPDDIEGALAKWRTALAGGEPFAHEARVRRGDGEYRWMLNRNVALVDDQGEIVRWFGSSTDIDDQKRVEAALRQTTDELRRSEFYLAEGQRLAHIGSWSFTADGKREYWSAEHFNIIGCDPLFARWSVLDGADKKVAVVKESRITRNAKDKSTDGSVAALSEAVGELSREIADAVSAINRARK